MQSKAIWIVFIFLCIVHQDVWFWHDRTLVFGFMPIGLAYHAGISAAAVCLWACAIKWAWPGDVEAWADELDGDTEQPTGQTTPQPEAAGGKQ